MANGVAEEVAEKSKLFEPGDFARLISWHPESVRRAIRQGRIHAVRFGKQWRIPCAEVARIMENGLPVS